MNFFGLRKPRNRDDNRKGSDARIADGVSTGSHLGARNRAKLYTPRIWL